MGTTFNSALSKQPNLAGRKVGAEVAAYLEAHRDERDDDGHALVVRNGKGRTRKVTVGAGTIPVRAPRVNDRRTDQDGERRRFTSRILPP